MRSKKISFLACFNIFLSLPANCIHCSCSKTTFQRGCFPVKNKETKQKNVVLYLLQQETLDFDSFANADIKFLELPFLEAG